MKTNNSVSTLKKKADKVFSIWIRTRDSENGYAECFTCGVQKLISQMQAGHFVSRAVNLLRYDEKNVHAQCYSCNVMKHGDLYTYAKKLDEFYGPGTADELHGQRFATHKFTVAELQQIIERYSNETEARYGRPASE
jgi:5-methylcytosine-specific restriction endonuclease McrA